jgi:hypothetical protein
VPEQVRLYLDEDTINRRLVGALRSRDIDVLTANEAGLVARSDQEHLDYAISAGRTVFTFNTWGFCQTAYPVCIDRQISCWNNRL